MLITLNKSEQLKQTYGSLVGEEALKDGASKITASVREVDIVGRLSLDQFVVILPETDASRALIVATRISEQISTLPFSQKFNSHPMSTSIGLSTFPTHARDENSLLTTAMQFLEQAKKLGMNQIVTS